MRGILAQAKNGDQLFWEHKFHAFNGKAQACTQGAFLAFFPFKGKGGFGGGGGFPLRSIQVPNGFSSGSPCSQFFSP